MQLRCTYCQTMFAMSRDEMLAALEHMAEENLKYYDAHCPKCRRANRVERARMEIFFPDWKNKLKAMAKAAREQQEQAAAISSPKGTSSPKGISPPKGKPATPAKAAAKATTKPAAASTSKDKKASATSFPKGASSPKGKPQAPAGAKKAPTTSSPKGTSSLKGKQTPAKPAPKTTSKPAAVSSMKGKKK